MVAPWDTFSHVQEGCESIPLPLTCCRGIEDEKKRFYWSRSIFFFQYVSQRLSGVSDCGLNTGFVNMSICLSAGEQERQCTSKLELWERSRSLLTRWILQLLEYQQSVQRVCHGTREKGCLQLPHHSPQGGSPALWPSMWSFPHLAGEKKAETYLHILAQEALVLSEKSSY